LPFGVVERPIIVQETDLRFLVADERLVLRAAGQQAGVPGEKLLTTAYPFMSYFLRARRRLPERAG